MAPRRNNNLSNNSVVQHYSLQQQQQQQQQQGLLITSVQLLNNLESSQETEQSQQQQQQYSLDSRSNSNMSPMQTCNNGSNSNGIATTNGHASLLNGSSDQQQYTSCCCPNGGCVKADSLIALNDLNECIRVICNNENCNVGQFMHRDCFESWEQAVLNTLKSMGRARSWTDRQKTQNLWSKKGYEMIYKACGCKCGRGHIRKDLEWSPGNALKNGLHFGNANNVAQKANSLALTNGNGLVNGNNNLDDDDKKKQKKKRNRNNNNNNNNNNTAANNNQNKVNLSITPLQQQNSFNQQSQQQQHQQQQQQQIQQQNAISQQNAQNSSMDNLNPMTNNPNVGVIGSGLHNNNSNNIMLNSSNDLINQKQQQQQQSLVTLNSILGLDLRGRSGSFSSSGAGSSGSTSPSQSSSIELSPIQNNQLHYQQQQQQQQHLQQIQNYQNALMISQQNQQSDLNDQQQTHLNGLTKRLLNGGIPNNLLISKQNSSQPQLQMTTSSPQQQQPSNQQIISNIFQQLSTYDQQQLRAQQKNKEVEIYSERVRSTSGCNGIFSRRLDFSSFNLLPKTRLNSYQVKIEDEGNHGNDETRLFILSSLAQSQMSRVACILCEEPMLVFDRYPLVDGSFFLSPKQHSAGCIEVKYEGRSLFLTCVCMSCLDGSCSNRVINCRFCGEIWDGSNLVLGTMYAYDIFAAMPCCAERLKCNNCFKLLLHPQQRLNFYSDYSHCVTCPYCATQDTHFVKPLNYCYTKNNSGRNQQIA